MGFNDVETTRATLEEAGYVCTTEIATVVFLAAAGDKPVLVEGPAGVGKTELAKAVAQGLGRELIRLQCYEGLDEAKALYEWEYAKQLLYTQIVRDKISDVVAGAQTLGEAVDGIAAEADAFFSERFLLPRPLLKAIVAPEPAVAAVPHRWHRGRRPAGGPVHRRRARHPHSVRRPARCSSRHSRPDTACRPPHR